MFSCDVQDIDYGRDGCEGRNGMMANATLAFADGKEARLITAQDTRFANNTKNFT
jgi:hypothetical protein